MRAVIVRCWRDEGAATAVEYALLAGCIALAVIVGFGAALGAIASKFDLISNTVSGG